MSAEDFLERMVELCDGWTSASKTETDQTKLYQACESFIVDMVDAMHAADAHPAPPYPRIRP